MALSEGDAVAGYRIVRLLGAGGMGTVYLAVNPVLPRQDALKVLSSELSEDASFRARFIREADLAASLDHPNVVTVYTRGQTDEGQLWIAMQYVDGSDALKECDAGRLTIRRISHVVTEVGKALDYAHRRNLVHRDVKPANFLLAAHDDRVMLADFGVARALDDAAELTGAGSVMATLAYAAPETLDEGRVDGRADIYALGCSLYRMLCGTTPFASAGSAAAMVNAHLRLPPPRVTDRVPRLPEVINGVVAKAMAKNPDDRYRSARELADAAHAALMGRTTAVAQPISRPTPQPLPPPPMPPTFVAAPPRRRRGRRVGVAVAALVAIGVITGATLVWTNRSTEPTYSARTLTHTYGGTDLASEPTSVAAVGIGDADAVLSLGTQPVVIVAADGLPSWQKELITGDVPVLAQLDTAAITAAQPDVIIATGNLDEQQYAELASIAPTVARPAQTEPWTWQDRQTWIGRILGEESAAAQLVADSQARQDAVRGEHPAFVGKSVEIVNVGDDGVALTLAGSSAANYLAGLGFQYSDELVATDADTADQRPVDVESINPTSVDVRIVVRTDAEAGDGKYNGLPRAFSQYEGITVIVDEPDVIAALDAGGYAATQFLDANLVPALGRQIH